jgi:Cu-processing system permease protein
VRRDIQAADVAVRPIFRGLAYVIFYGSTVFLVLGCSDFAPRLLAPGRIEYLLSLPIRRFELIAGTYLGVLGLGALVAIYGAGGLVVILGFKTGVWTLMPIVAALLGLLAFATIYAAMLATAIVVRSSALSTAVGGVLFIAGLVAGKRDTLLPIWERGLGRTVFATVTLFVPRVSALGNACAGLASAERLAPAALISLLAGFLLFAAAGLALAIWLFERRDF